VNDTRLHQITELLTAARTLIAELQGEDIPVAAYVDLGHADHSIDRAQGCLGRVS
jgi:hypothetical protein